MRNTNSYLRDEMCSRLIFEDDFFVVVNALLKLCVSITSQFEGRRKFETIRLGPRLDDTILLFQLTS